MEARGLATVRDYARTLRPGRRSAITVAPWLHVDRGMAGRTPRSYDEITRKTVPELDSSYRPTADQERAAFEGERILSADERVLHTAVSNALDASGLDVSDVAIEIDGSRVTLRGRVPAIYLLPRIEAVVRDVDDVGDIVDFIVVEPGAR